MGSLSEPNNYDKNGFMLLTSSRQTYHKVHADIFLLQSGDINILG